MPLQRHLGHGIGLRPPHYPRILDGTARADWFEVISENLLEWARRDVFDAPDCEPLTADALRAVRSEDWPQLRFAPIPALAVLRADWLVHEVWGGTDAASLASAPTVIRVWRAQDYRVYHASMDARDAEALDRMMAGQPFEIVCTAFDDLSPLEGAERATALLARWLEDGIIARVF